MKLLILLTLWPPFGSGGDDDSPDPEHYHNLEGPQIKYHDLNGAS